MTSIPALVRFDAYATLTPEDVANLIPLVGQPTKISRGEHIFHEGDPAPNMALLLDGWTASTISLPDGGRQMLKVHLPGDMVGLPGAPLDVMPDSVVALTDVTYSPIRADALGRLFEASPRVAALLFLISQEERYMLMDRLTTVGRVETPGRIAGFLLQLHARMLRQNPGIGQIVRCPLSQRDFADLVGTSETHCNRSIQELRHLRLVDWKMRQIMLLDIDGLRDLAMLPQRRVRRDQSWLPLVH